LENMADSVEAGRVALKKISKPKAQDSLPLCDKKTLALVASFQRSVVDDLGGETLGATSECHARRLFGTGGVAGNSQLPRTFEAEAWRQAVPVFVLSRKLSSDNAAMIATAAYPKFLAEDFAGAEFSAEASLVLS